MRASISCVATLALIAAACGGGPSARIAPMGGFRTASVGASSDPTVRPARLLPEAVDGTMSFGSEAGGGTRVLTGGLRVVTSPKGAIFAASDRLPQVPQITTALPERLGGGFLFVIGNTAVWRADHWLGPARPIFTSLGQIQGLVPGLDRVYVRAHHAVFAIDGQTGHVLDLGPWPASPHVASYAAADGWRAAAVTDMRGVVATFDAGATWRSLDLSLDAKQVVVSNGSLAIGGVEHARSEAWYELRADGSLTRLGEAPREAKTRLSSGTPPRPTNGGGSFAPPPPRSTATGRASHEEARSAADLATKTFGERPLASAIEDGWPLSDGTAVVARDGALGRVRLSDGTLIEHVRDAFPLKPARCHPFSLSRPNAVGAFGFVCGEPRGTTVLYAYEPDRGGLTELKRFDKPRVVTSSGNGALAVRGPCAEDGDPTPPPVPDSTNVDKSAKDDGHDPQNSKAKGAAPPAGHGASVPSDKGNANAPATKAAAARPSLASAPPPAPTSAVHPYCVFGHDNTWREVHVRGDVGGERVVVLADGRVVVVSPPQGPDAPARLTILDKGRATTVPVVFPRVPSDMGRVLRLGFWLDGFE
ncbi:MAG TPA: hypothetical protein VM580_27720, partial [Labilithrix sp.]|nr:hypothetical protein [Labilithrix sp.]